MNIFVTSECPQSCAKFLDDKRVVKMVLETAQMLSTSMLELGIQGAPYRSTHANHPCTKWVRETPGNFRWTVQHFIALCQEYTSRYDKIHACESHTSAFIDALHHFESMSSEGMTPFANCSAYKDDNAIGSVYDCYKQTMIDKWRNDSRPARVTFNY